MKRYITVAILAQDFQKLHHKGSQGHGCERRRGHGHGRGRGHGCSRADQQAQREIPRSQRESPEERGRPAQGP